MSPRTMISLIAITLVGVSFIAGAIWIGVQIKVQAGSYSLAEQLAVPTLLTSIGLALIPVRWPQPILIVLGALIIFLAIRSQIDRTEKYRRRQLRPFHVHMLATLPLVHVWRLRRKTDKGRK